MKIQKYLSIKNHLAHAKYLLSKRPKVSYAQNGEDLLINSAIIETLKIDKPNYLDIGTYEPIYSNNTYYFYRRGSRGVCIEPDPQIFQKVKSKRPKDICLNVGVGISDEKSADYYVMSSKYLSTFKKEDAQWHVARGKQKIEKIIKIPLVTIDSVIEKYFPQGVDILSIDTEGYDLEILKSLDFTKYAPKLICAETLRYDADGQIKKVTEIGDFLLSNGYSLFADTHVNSIYIKNLNSI